MKKYLLITFTFIGILTSGLHASFEQGYCSPWYMSGIAGVNYIDSDTELGAQLGFALGYRLSPSIRLEGELVARVNNIKEIDAQFSTGVLGLNILYDLNINSRIKPYFGFGVGSQHREISFEDEDFIFRITDHALAYQGIFGVCIPISSHTVTSLEYRYAGNDVGSDVSHSLGLTAKKHF